MINNIPRIGNITSSECVALLSMGSRDMTPEEMEAYKKANPKGQKKKIECWPGQAALTYIEECNMERRLGRSLTDESNARPLSWGKLLEPQVFNLLGLEYSFSSQETIVHPDIPYWAGSPDGYTDDAVVDMKCPLTLKSFCQLVHPLYEEELHMTEVNGKWVYNGNKAINWVRENHKDGEKYYWQLVSNAILLNKQFAELIVYMPYASELPAIKLLAQKASGELISKYYWVVMAGPDDLPFLIEGRFYRNLNVIRFEVPQADKDHLTTRVLQAGEYLIKPPSVITAHHDAEVGATIVQ